MTIDILKRLRRSHNKTIKDHFRESFLERARNRVRLAWRRHVILMIFLHFCIASLPSLGSDTQKARLQRTLIGKNKKRVLFNK